MQFFSFIHIIDLTVCVYKENVYVYVYVSRFRKNRNTHTKDNSLIEFLRYADDSSRH